MGNGIDIIEIHRIVEATKSEHFTSRVYTGEELKQTKKVSHRLAGFFAAKEALLKAMGTGLSCFSWQEIEIKHNDKGAPYFEVSGKVKKFLTEMDITQIHLSISHGRDYAVSQVILEKKDR